MHFLDEFGGEIFGELDDGQLNDLTTPHSANEISQAIANFGQNRFNVTFTTCLATRGPVYNGEGVQHKRGRMASTAIKNSLERNQCFVIGESKYENQKD